jgi:nucleoside-diphosphate-sugar epimerase
MRIFVAGTSDAIGARLVPQLINLGHKVIGIYESPRNAERVRALGAAPSALDQQPTRAWRSITGSS